jgi:ABC-type multidrug transport system fused ATPase/permease subunit
MFQWELVASGWLRLIADLLQFIVPLILLLFIQQLESVHFRLWKALSISIILFASQQVRYLTLNYVSLIGSQVGINIATTLQSVVYKKVSNSNNYNGVQTLRLTTNSLESQDQKLQELLKHDVKAVQRFFSKLHLIWSPILQLALIFYLFYIILYITALPLVFLTVLLIVANFCSLANTNSSKESGHLRLFEEVLKGKAI